jgi:uncharacterized Zn-binding protein involved in type VI secretion
MAARISDNHFCRYTEPTIHKGGPVNSGSPNVFTGGQPQARVGDTAHCDAPLDDRIVKGSDTVFVNGIQAARFGDPTDGGLITGGCTTVFIGDSGGGSGGSDLANASNNATPMLQMDPPEVPTPGSLADDNIATQTPASTDASNAGDAGGQTGGQDATGATTNAAPPVELHAVALKLPPFVGPRPPSGD